MSSPFNEVEDSRHADALFACFAACGHMRLSAEHRAIVVGTVEELFLVLTGKEMPQ